MSIGDLRLLEERRDYVVFANYRAINGEAVRLPSCPYVPIYISTAHFIQCQ
jgi:hypothetical protein